MKKNNNVRLAAVLTAATLAMAAILAGCGSSGGAKTADTAAAPSQAASAAPSGQETAAPQAAQTTAAPGAAAAPTGNTANANTTIRIGNYNNAVFVGSLDPTGATGPGPAHSANYLVYDKLLVYGPNGYFSRILSDWGWEDDTTFYGVIKDEVKFNNGDPMTPDDILFTYKLIQDQSWMSSWYSFLDMDASYGEGQKVVLKLKHPFALSEFYFSFAGLVNQDVFEKKLADAGGVYEAMKPIDPAFVDGLGSGPYEITLFVNNDSANFKLRQDWWGMAEYGSTLFAEIDTKIYGDQTTMGVDLETGVIDMALDCSNMDATRASQGGMGDAAAKIIFQNTDYYLRLSELSDKLKDVKVKQAIAACIDEKAITKAAVGDAYGIPSKSVIPESNGEGYMTDEEIAQYYTYDPEKSKEILHSLGYADGELQLTILAETNVTPSKIGELVQAQLMAGGFGASLVTTDPFSMEQYLDGSGKIDIVVTYATDNPTANGFACISNSQNSRFKDLALDDIPEFNTLFLAAREAVTEAEADKALKDYSSWMYQDYKWLGLFHYSQVLLYNPNVVDIDNSFITSVINIDMSLVNRK
ncbi:MAG: ABC transporter substrate-binding protein [Lachnospiraceae bacterium]|jgi:ABC-type transport system substrate-binding protein|nr:ABC transporter substrate-binding protein [Lachnospiraceae bacterium]